MATNSRRGGGGVSGTKKPQGKAEVHHKGGCFWEKGEAEVHLDCSEDAAETHPLSIVEMDFWGKEKEKP